MKLMSSLKGLVLAAMLACVAHAEQRVIVVNTIQYDTPDLSQVNRLLVQGWRITFHSSAGAQSRIWLTFVLESPTKETVK